MMIGIGTPSSQSRIERPICRFLVALNLRLPAQLHTLYFQVPSRRPPPSIAARLAANAPTSSDAVSHSDSCAAALRDALTAVLARSMVADTRSSACTGV